VRISSRNCFAFDRSGEDYACDEKCLAHPSVFDYDNLDNSLERILGSRLNRPDAGHKVCECLSYTLRAGVEDDEARKELVDQIVSRPLEMR
jgi:hypothetical protein